MWHRRQGIIVQIHDRITFPIIWNVSGFVATFQYLLGNIQVNFYDDAQN